MNETTTKKRGPAAIFLLCPARHALALLGALVIALHLATRGNYAFNRTLSDRLIRPIHRFLSKATASLPFSLAEVLIGLAVVSTLVYIIFNLV